MARKKSHTAERLDFTWVLGRHIDVLYDLRVVQGSRDFVDFIADVNDRSTRILLSKFLARYSLRVIM